MKRQHFDVILIGGGITNAALAYVLTHYTNLGPNSIALFELGGAIGAVNSHSKNNSQTLHDGSAETNYTRDKAILVKRATDIMAMYLETKANQDIYRLGPKMVMGAGDAEVAELLQRFEDFKELYPSMECINGTEIGRREPFVMKGRDPKQPIVALANDGYTIDFGKLAESFVEQAMTTGKLSLFMKTGIATIQKEGDHYVVTDSTGKQYTANVIVSATGAYSLLFAKSLGLAEHLGLIPIGGSFYDTTQPFLHGKVYTVQRPGLPFAAVHGDPEIHNEGITRFGPTAMVVPMLMQGDWSTMIDFFKASVPNWKGVRTLAGILADPVMSGYMAHNMLYTLPMAGKWFFLQTARKIIPTLQYSDLVFHQGKGMRPQIVNTLTGKLEMGDAQILGDNAIFNVTPSPGASVSLPNGYRDALKVMEFFKGEYEFNSEKWQEDFSHHPEHVELA